LMPKAGQAPEAGKLPATSCSSEPSIHEWKVRTSNPDAAVGPANKAKATDREVSSISWQVGSLVPVWEAGSRLDGVWIPFGWGVDPAWMGCGSHLDGVWIPFGWGVDPTWMGCGSHLDGVWIPLGWGVDPAWMGCGSHLDGVWIPFGWGVDPTWMGCGSHLDGVWIPLGWGVDPTSDLRGEQLRRHRWRAVGRLRSCRNGRQILLRDEGSEGHVDASQGSLQRLVLLAHDRSRGSRGSHPVAQDARQNGVGDAGSLHVAALHAASRPNRGELTRRRPNRGELLRTIPHAA
jgi:hypothetical protein